MDVENGQAWHQRASFNCYHCQTNITSVEAASIHMTTHHSENLNPETNGCILCPKELPSLTALVIHLWRHFQKALSIPSTQKWLETQIWKCKTCREDLQGLKAYWEHLEFEHGVTGKKAIISIVHTHFLFWLLPTLQSFFLKGGE